MGDVLHAGADPELVALRAVLDAYATAVRDAQELAAAVHLLPRDERRNTVADIIDRLAHLADITRG